MGQSILARLVNPWTFGRRQQAERLAALRKRDGDDCRRCRRPMRFDLPLGHDHGPRFETIPPGGAIGRAPLEKLCLTHGRCNLPGANHTDEVAERVRLKAEAKRVSKARKPKRAKSPKSRKPTRTRTSHDISPSRSSI